LCRALKVRERQSEPDGTEVLVADLTAAYKLISERLTSRVTLDRPNLQIMVQYLDGPFSWLENRWTFRPAGEGSCDVEFFISYEFKSRMLALLMGSMFDHRLSPLCRCLRAACRPGLRGNQCLTPVT